MPGPLSAAEGTEIEHTWSLCSSSFTLRGQCERVPHITLPSEQTAGSESAPYSHLSQDLPDGAKGNQ